jgi:hypothetical protein
VVAGRSTRSLAVTEMTDAELIQAIESLRNTMVSVATGGPRIGEVDNQYQRTFRDVATTLQSRGIENPIPFASLWDWYGRWSSGDLPSYQSRRQFASELFNPLLTRIRSGKAQEFEPTGWARVDRNVGELRDKLAAAKVEEHFQTVGLLCREALISLAQAVFVAEQHPTVDGVKASSTDAKRMLEAYFVVELGGGANDEARKHARSALDLAVNLQHKRTATFREAAMCVEATTSVINIIAIVSGRRDPQ